MSRFDNLIHQPVRLRIMSALSTLGPDESVDFWYLKKLLNLTDGNLGSHLEKLEGAGYLEVLKTAVGKKPKTYLKMTLAGRAAYQGHREALEELLGD
ncbi:MAG: transcriptional regulator [Verrucomicrobiota bacterium]